MSHLPYMQHALRLAERGLGRTWPNPSVGAVIVKDRQVIGAGATARGGRPHAEKAALAQAGKAAQGATLYVTLEPCAHHGQTPPCTEAIIAAGIARVVVACGDPNPLVAGKGIAAFKSAGIEVVEGVREAEAIRMNEGFFSVITRGRPFVSLKIATSLDGRIATASGESRWITGEASRAYGHYLRGCHDAILTGIGTVLADDPALTCRLPLRESDSPQRVVLDSGLRTPVNARCLPAWIYADEKRKDDQKRTLEKAGATVFGLQSENGKLSLPEVLAHLAGQGITRLLVEAGSGVSSEFIAQGLADRLYWFRAPVIIGREGVSVFTIPPAPLAGCPRFTLETTRAFGDDTLTVFSHTPT